MTIFRHELRQGRTALIIWSASIAFLFAVCVEVLQYFRLAELLGLQGNAVARIILGSVFDWKDIACYGAGCLLIQIFEIRRRAL